MNVRDRLAIVSLSTNAALLAKEVGLLTRMLGRVYNLKDDGEKQRLRDKRRKVKVQSKILDHPEARQLFLQMYRENRIYDEMVVGLNRIKDFSVSRSAIARLWQRVSKGEVDL
jgi:hypothetical protein